MDLALYYERYSKEKVDKAIEVLTYKKVDPMPKEELDGHPIMYIFRHGQSEDNLNMVFSGWRDPGITQKGTEQALVLAPILKDKKIDMLISSDQLRALQTLEHAISQNEHAKTLEINKDPRIKERDYGLLNGYSKLELFLYNEKLLKAYRRSWSHKVPEGESLEEVCERVAEFCKEIVPLMKDTNVNVAISCHGNSIRGFRKYFENLSEEDTVKIETPTGRDYLAYSIK